MSISILHLSDIHAGKMELKDEDLKQRVPDAERERMIERLTNYLRSLSSPPDYVAISGDFTIQGDEQGFIDFRKWLTERVSEGSLPSYENIIITPGNHDVIWRVENREGWHKERYKYIFENLCKFLPHAYVPECDPSLNYKNFTIPTKPSTSLGGLTTVAKLGKVEIDKSFPFLLDLEKDILLFAFNSTLGCGVYLPTDSNIIQPLGGLCAIFDKNDVIKEKIIKIRNSYKESLLVDAGLVGEDQLKYFSNLMTKIRNRLGSKYNRLTKIAILHHHISQLWRQQLEVKIFESVLDAAQLKQSLIEYEFDMVLHGHKHTNHVSLDGSIIPISSKKPFSPICICSGGTISGYPRLNDTQSFKVIIFDEDTGPRTSATVMEVPLLDDPDPRHVIQNESKIYPVPISSRLPGLHDLPDVKEKLDSFLRDKYAKELKTDGHLVVSGAKSQLPPADTDIVSKASKYNFDCIIDKSAERIFYDIILATRTLNFRQRARIYWMLTDVKSLANREKKKSKIVILIGNLEGTHFFRGQIRGEINESIKLIKKWFSPALKGSLLQIRQHNFVQDEVEELAKVAAERI